MSSKKINAIKPEQVALISAGAAGIGRAIAEIFLAHDCHVHIFDINADAIAEFLKGNPGATATRADISNVAEVEDVFDDLADRYGRLDNSY